MIRRAGLVSLGLWLGFPLASASAQDPEVDAERLFREGQKLMEERRFSEACPKFERAYKRDGQLGTLLNLAFCHKEQGAVWYAWLEFREAELKATEQGRADRRDFAKAQLTALEKSLARVVVDNPKSVPLVDVLVDDRRVPEAEKSAVFFADVGQRKIVFRAKGRKTAKVLVDVKKGDKPLHVALPEMEKEEASPESAPEPSPAASGDGRAGGDGIESRATLPAGRSVRPSVESSQKTLALGAFGVAAIGGIVMGVAGIMTLTNDCAALGDNSKCVKNDEGIAEKDRGDTTALIATIGGVVMLAGGAAGALLWLTSPKEADAKTSQKSRVDVRPELGLGYAGVTGSF